MVLGLPIQGLAEGHGGNEAIQESLTATKMSYYGRLCFPESTPHCASVGIPATLRSSWLGPQGLGEPLNREIGKDLHTFSAKKESQVILKSTSWSSLTLSEILASYKELTKGASQADVNVSQGSKIRAKEQTRLSEEESWNASMEGRSWGNKSKNYFLLSWILLPVDISLSCSFFFIKLKQIHILQGIYQDRNTKWAQIGILQEIALFQYAIN